VRVGVGGTVGAVADAASSRYAARASSATPGGGGALTAARGLADDGSPALRGERELGSGARGGVAPPDALDAAMAR